MQLMPRPAPPRPLLPAHRHSAPAPLRCPPRLAADAPAQDSDYQMETEEYFASQGRLISEEDLQVGGRRLGGGWRGNWLGAEPGLLGGQAGGGSWGWGWGS